jgi:LysR family hydrogen peroxide-inducible transcriptional activator
VQLHQLQYAVAIAREGSFTRAAEALYLAQPSLSVQIRKLEQELGVRLFERHGRRATLTSVGRLFLEHAQRVLGDLDRLYSEMEEIKDVRLGRVALGVLPSVGTGLLPDVLCAYRRLHPAVELVLLEQDLDASADFQRRVYEGELDMAVVRMLTVLPGLRAELLVREPIVALLPPGHRLAEHTSVPLAELAEETFVALRTGGGLRTLMNELCGRAGFLPAVSVETGQLSILWSMVQAGLGVAIVPRLAAGGQSTAVRIADDYARRELGLIQRAAEPLSPSALAFRKVLMTFAASCSEGGYEQAP